MSAREATCPECDCVMDLDARELSRGKARCPECGASFRLPKGKGKQDREPTREEMNERRRARRRAQAELAAKLGILRIGLGLHSAAVLCLLVSNWAFWIGMGLGLLGVLGYLPALALLGGGAFLVGMAAFGVAGLLQVPANLLGLWVPSGLARGLLLLSIGACALVLAADVWLLLGSASPWLPRTVALIAMGGAWFLWVLFLYNLGTVLEDESISDEAIMHLWLAPLTILVGFLALCFLLFLVVVMILKPIGGGILLAFVVGMALGMTKYIDRGPFEVLLMPTGIPYLIRYYNLIATIRHKIGE